MTFTLIRLIIFGSNNKGNKEGIKSMKIREKFTKVYRALFRELSTMLLIYYMRE